MVVMDQLLKDIHTGLAYYKNNSLHIDVSLKFIVDFYYTAKHRVRSFSKISSPTIRVKYDVTPLCGYKWFKCDWGTYKSSIIQFSRTKGRHWVSYNIRSNDEANNPMFITIVSL